MVYRERLSVGMTAIAAAACAGMMLFVSCQRELKQSSSTEEEEVNVSDTSKMINRLNPALQMAGQAKFKRKAKTFFRNQPNATHVIRIALTGGPCAGKSSALSHLRRKATREGFDVYCAPETATLIFNSGVMFPTTSEEEFIFQRSVCSLQLSIERNLTSMAQATGRPSIIIFDRGLLDSKAFVARDTWEKILSELTTGNGVDKHDSSEGSVKGVTEEYCLKRYDGVVHMITAADGASQFYKTGAATDDLGNKVFRRETPEQAVALDKKVQEAWKEHPRQHVIKNGGTFQQKLGETTDVILNMARESHPREYKRASAINMNPDEMSLE